MSGPVSVRLVRDDEHEAVADLLEAAYTHDYEIGDEYRASLRAVAERAAEHQVWVAAEGDALLGSVATPRPGRHISPLGREGELDFRLLGVHPGARGRGVGRLLTQHVVDLARRRGLRRVVMNSGPQMLGAHALYASLGFRRLTEREVRLPDGRPLLTFGLDLPAAAGAAASPAVPTATTTTAQE